MYDLPSLEDLKDMTWSQIGERLVIREEEIEAFDSVTDWWHAEGCTFTFDGRGAIRKDCLVCNDYVDRKNPHRPGCPIPDLLDAGL